MRCVRECFPRKKGGEGNFTCKFLIFRVKIFLTLVRFRVGEWRGGGNRGEGGIEGRGNYGEKRGILGEGGKGCCCCFL